MIKTGASASITKKFSNQDVVDFSVLSMDSNPIHLDEVYALGSIFKKRIVHGFLYSSLISAVIGTKMPGVGTIYMQQSLKFLRPVYIGDEITATVTVKEVDEEKMRARLETVCTNQQGEKVVDGEALVKLP